MDKKSTPIATVLTLSLLCSGMLVSPLYAERGVETIQAEIAQLSTGLATRTNNAKIAQLKQELAKAQGGNSSTQTSSAVAPIPPAPQATAPVMASTRTPQTIQAEIAQLSAGLPTRTNTSKIAQLKKELASAQPASAISPMLQGTQKKTMLPPSQEGKKQTLAQAYGRDDNLVSFKQSLIEMKPYLTKGDGADGHFKKMDQLTSDDKLKAYGIAEDIVWKSQELLKTATDPQEKKSLEDYNRIAKLYAKELHPLNGPL